MRKKWVVFAVAGLVGASAYAQQTPAPSEPAPDCTIATISVSFAFDGASSAIAKNELDDRLYKLNGFLINNQIEHLETQSLCYKVSQLPPAANVAPAYRVAGTAEYQINSPDAAFKLGEFFTQQKFEVTVSKKTDTSGKCAAPEVKKPVVPSPVSVGAPPAIKSVDAPVAKLVESKEKKPDIAPVLSKAPPSLAPGATSTATDPIVPQLPALNQAPPSEEPTQ